MSFCGLRKPPQPAPLRLKKEAKKNDKRKAKDTEQKEKISRPIETSQSSQSLLDVTLPHDNSDSDWRELLHRTSANFDWAQADQLSTILEILEDNASRIDDLDLDTTSLLEAVQEEKPRKPHVVSVQARVDKPRRVESTSKPGNITKSYRARIMSTSMSERRQTFEEPRPIEPPPTDLEQIAAIDKSLVFEHFTTNDAWELGSALRNRLLAIPIPVVINISLANQNQTLFHACTHTGVMPDNDTWVARKRKTVLRWGCSTWYMHCKFDGDEFAFRDKYGLGNSAGEYAIHGGGVPIRVTGVEGVVAVVVVSGLKQAEDHAIVVEVIRELYY